jgi:uncharacterized RDD family membrane protein YckC
VSRFLAAGVDALVAAAMLSGLRLGLISLGEVLVIVPPTVRTMARAFYWASSIMLVPAYHVLFWSIAGRTPGKWLLGLRVVRGATGTSPGLLRAAARFAAYTVSIAPLFAGVLAIAFDPRRRAWHDRLAGTLVVYDRAPVGGRVKLRVTDATAEIRSAHRSPPAPLPAGTAVRGGPGMGGG